MTDSRILAAILIILGCAGTGFSQRAGVRFRETLDVSAHNRVSLKSWLRHPLVARARKHYVSVTVTTPVAAGHLGTGIIIKKGLVLTNIHLIIDFENQPEKESAAVEFTAEFADKNIDEEYQVSDIYPEYNIFVEGKPAKVLAMDLARDLLLLKVSTRKVRPIKLRTHVEVEEPVFYIGNPTGRSKGFGSSGAIRAAGKHGIITNIYVRPGSSGSGLFSALDGKLLGINSDYYCEGENDTCRESLSRNSADIRRFLKKSGIRLK